MTNETKLPILSIHPGALTPFALKLKPDDTLDSIKTRAAKKLAIPKAQIHGGGGGDGSEKGLEAKYQWASVWYGLDDDDDFDAFLERAKSLREVPVSLTHPSIPNAPVASPTLSGRPSTLYSPSTYRLGDGFADAGLNAGFGGNPQNQQQHHHSRDDDSSLFSASMPGLNANSRPKKPEPSLHLIASSATEGEEDARSQKSGKSTSKKSKQAPGAVGGGAHKPRSISGMSGMTAAQQGAVSGVPAHKIAFEKFHNELGVRTFIGSIGPIENVRMMMKPGHRACYMSRSFALAHNFIPRDAAPGFYGFSGITNLGSWPIRIGEKTVEQQVMLVENSYFPVVLGRSFMEKRGVKTDPLDQTSVIFMDTGETVACDIVVVKDQNGNPIPVP